MLGMKKLLAAAEHIERFNAVGLTSHQPISKLFACNL